MGQAEAHAELWRQQGRLLGELETMARAPARSASATTVDLHDYARIKAVLLHEPRDIDKFAEELAAFLVQAGVTPEELTEAVAAAGYGDMIGG